jgi:hypothetical protein
MHLMLFWGVDSAASKSCATSLLALVATSAGSWRRGLAVASWRIVSRMRGRRFTAAHVGQPLFDRCWRLVRAAAVTRRGRLRCLVLPAITPKNGERAGRLMSPHDPSYRLHQGLSDALRVREPEAVMPQNLRTATWDDQLSRRACWTGRSCSRLGLGRTRNYRAILTPNSLASSAFICGVDHRQDTRCCARIKHPCFKEVRCVRAGQ